MKNIHILPTDKPSRLLINWEKDLCYKSKPYLMEGTQNIYITSDEEIKVGDWCLGNQGTILKVPLRWISSGDWKKIILKTDQDLIKDGVQAIDDEFLEWFVKNTSCEEVDIDAHVQSTENGHILYYQIIIPKKEVLLQSSIDGKVIWGEKQETIEEAINREFPLDNSYKEREAMFIGVKWQKERSYSEEDLEVAFFEGQFGKYSFNDWLEQFKKK